MSRIHITIQYDCTLTIDEVWPNGDAPEVITKDDVMAVLNAEGIYRVPTEWNFPLPLVSVGLSGFDVHGRIRHAEKLLNHQAVPPGVGESE